MRYCVFTVWCCILFLCPAYAAEPLRVAVEAEYPPFAYTDKQGVLSGFDVEIAQALCATIKRQCTFTPMPFQEILPAIVKGDIDIGAIGFAATEDRMKLVDFTEYYFRSRSIFIEKPGSVRGLTVGDLQGKRVGVQLGSIQEQYLKKTYGSAVILVQKTDFSNVLRDLQSGKTDIILADGLPTYAALKSELGAGLETLGEPVDTYHVAALSCMAVSKKLPELREELNRAIRAIVRSGEYDKINRKYFDFNIY